MLYNRVRGFEKNCNERVHLVDYWPGRVATCSDPNQAVQALAILFYGFPPPSTTPLKCPIVGKPTFPTRRDVLTFAFGCDHEQYLDISEAVLHIAM